MPFVPKVTHEILGCCLDPVKDFRKRPFFVDSPCRPPSPILMLFMGVPSLPLAIFQMFGAAWHSGGKVSPNPMGPVLVSSIGHLMQLHLVSTPVHCMLYANLLHLPHTHKNGMSLEKR